MGVRVRVPPVCVRAAESNRAKGGRGRGTVEGSGSIGCPFPPVVRVLSIGCPRKNGAEVAGSLAAAVFVRGQGESRLFRVYL